MFTFDVAHPQPKAVYTFTKNPAKQFPVSKQQLIGKSASPANGSIPNT